MTVVEIGHRRDPKLRAILAELLQLEEQGRLTGFIYIAEVRDAQPKFGALGVLEADPYKGLATCMRLWTKLEQLADDSAERFQASG